MKRIPDAAYFRCQAEICVRLSRTTTEASVAAELVSMAEDFHARAAQLEGSDPSGSGRDLDEPRGDKVLGFAMLKQRKIVAVVDDDQMMLEAIEDLLDSLGFASKGFPSAEAYLDIGAAGEFDCILLDIHLGGMSGFELHRRLKASRPMFPVIFMTGSNDETMREQAFKAGCIAYLRKPFLARPLMEALEKATLQKE